MKEGGDRVTQTAGILDFLFPVRICGERVLGTNPGHGVARQKLYHYIPRIEQTSIQSNLKMGREVLEVVSTLSLAVDKQSSETTAARDAHR